MQARSESNLCGGLVGGGSYVLFAITFFEPISFCPLSQTPQLCPLPSSVCFFFVFSVLFSLFEFSFFTSIFISKYVKALLLTWRETRMDDLLVGWIWVVLGEWKVKCDELLLLLAFYIGPHIVFAFCFPYTYVHSYIYIYTTYAFSYINTFPIVLYLNNDDYVDNFVLQLNKNSKWKNKKEGINRRNSAVIHSIYLKSPSCRNQLLYASNYFFFSSYTNCVVFVAI